MADFVIVLCPYCGEPRAIRVNQKTFTCYRCGKRAEVSKARKVVGPIPSSRIPEIMKFLRSPEGRKYLMKL